MDNDNLLYAAEHGIIDLIKINLEAESMKRKEYLEKYPFKIWQGKNGRWYTYIIEDGKKKTVAKSSRESIEDVIIQNAKENEDNPTVKDIFDDWNDYRLQHKIITESSHLRMQQTFNRHFQEFGKRKIKRLKMIDCVEFLEDELAEKNLSAKSFAGVKTVMRGIVRRARRKELINFTADAMTAELDVSVYRFRKHREDDDREVYYDDEMEKILRYLMFHLQNSYCMAILVLFLTGLRIGEAVALKNDVIDPEHCCLYVRRTETKRDENGKVKLYVHEFTKTEAGRRTVVLPTGYKWLLERMQAISADQEYVFMRKAGNEKERIIAQGIRRKLERICSELDIPYKPPHKIRKTYDSILLDNGIGERFVLDQMGHVDMRMNEDRYHRNRKQTNTKAEILDKLKEFRVVV